VPFDDHHITDVMLAHEPGRFKRGVLGCTTVTLRLLISLAGMTGCFLLASLTV
jgi:hypothetical protein